MSNLWSLRDVELVSGRTKRLGDINIDVRTGTTAVLGFSGAGKTSLTNLLVEFERPTAGTIRQTLPPASVPVFWVPQNGGLWNHVTAAGHIENVDRHSTDAGAWLSKFNLEHRAASYPAELSQGERARLSVARALASEAGVLVMDEPLAHVDPARVSTYFDLIAEHVTAGDQPRSLVFATHQPELVLRYATYVICLDGGECVFSGLVRDLYEKPASSRLAALLGHGNWISADEFATWLDQVDHGEGVVRPERLRLVKSEASRFQVVTTRRMGPVTETTVRNSASGQQRKFVHATAERLQLGQGVQLSILNEDPDLADE